MKGVNAYDLTQSGNCKPFTKFKKEILTMKTQESSFMSEEEFIRKFCKADKQTQRIIEKLAYEIDLNPEEQAYVNKIMSTKL